MIMRRSERLASLLSHRTGIARRPSDGYPSVVQAVHRRRFSAATHDQQQQQRDWLDYCITTVRRHDPDSFLPGHLLTYGKNGPVLSAAYFAIRAFWVETGLRFGSTAGVALNATPAEHLEWWQDGMNHVFTDRKSSASIDPSNAGINEFQHPVLSCLRHLKEAHALPWSQSHFDHVLAGRRRDLDVKQYETMDDLMRHAQQSCGTLSQLVLQSASLMAETHPLAHQAALHTGTAHGLVNALKYSIPVLSTTGKLVIPAELTVRHGVRSPRYLLSALSMGDATCERALQASVRDMVDVARHELAHARSIHAQASASERDAASTVATMLLPIVSSEAFLNRLQQHEYQLTNRNLRQSAWWDPALHTVHVLSAYAQSKF